MNEKQLERICLNDMDLIIGKSKIPAKAVMEYQGYYIFFRDIGYSKVEAHRMAYIRLENNTILK